MPSILEGDPHLSKSILFKCVIVFSFFLSLKAAIFLPPTSVKKAIYIYMLCHFTSSFVLLVGITFFTLYLFFCGGQCFSFTAYLHISCIYVWFGGFKLQDQLCTCRTSCFFHSVVLFEMLKMFLYLLMCLFEKHLFPFGGKSRSAVISNWIFRVLVWL